VIKDWYIEVKRNTDACALKVDMGALPIDEQQVEFLRSCMEGVRVPIELAA
jgi:hypothetical protein